MFKYEIQTGMSSMIDPEIEGITLDSIISLYGGVEDWAVYPFGRYIKLVLYSENENLDLSELEKELAENFESEGNSFFENIRISKNDKFYKP